MFYAPCRLPSRLDGLQKIVMLIIKGPRHFRQSFAHEAICIRVSFGKGHRARRGSGAEEERRRLLDFGHNVLGRVRL